MGRKPHSPKAKIVYRLICDQPGIKREPLAKLAGEPDSRNIETLLASCESAGYLLTEDHEGRLYPFDPDMWG